MSLFIWIIKFSIIGFVQEICVVSTSASPNSSDFSPKVFPGVRANQQNYPYIGSIQTRDNLWHKGPFTLVSANIGVTSACTVYNVAKEDIIGLLGNIKRNVGYSVNFRSISDPEHISSNNYNAISVLIFTYPVPFTAYIQPIALAIPNQGFIGTIAMFASWAGTKIGESNPELYLHELPFRIVDKSNYPTYLPIRKESVVVTEKLGDCICFKGLDRGGPLIVKTEDRDLFVGVLSQLSKSCLHGNYPTVFTSVAYYRNFILDQIAKYCQDQ